MEQTVLAKKRNNEEVRLAWFLLAPAVLLLVLFMVYPIFYVFTMSFFKTDKLSNLREFVGLKNYIFMLSSPDTWIVILRTILWTLSAVVVKTIFGLVIALLLNVPFRGRKPARLLFIVPWASSVPISVMLWRWVFHHEFGLLNHTLRLIGWSDPPVWLGEKFTALLSTLWVDISLGIPFMALVFLAGMQAIPSSLYEAADVDGATGVQKFTHITIPGIRDILLIATLLSSLWTFNDFNTIYILTNGGPAGSTEILITYIYNNSFAWLKWHNAAVLSVITFIILSVVSIFYAKFYFAKEGE